MGEERGRREAFTLIRLHVVVEGQTEEGFVNDVLGPALAAHHVFVDAHLITTKRHHGTVFRGGLVNYDHLARDLTLWMKQDQNDDSWFTTMIDFYALPANVPGLNALPPTLDPATRVAALETELRNDIARRLAGLLIAQRIGLAPIRAVCPHFDAWITRLLALTGTP